MKVRPMIRHDGQVRTNEHPRYQLPRNFVVDVPTVTVTDSKKHGSQHPITIAAGPSIPNRQNRSQTKSWLRSSCIRDLRRMQVPQN